MMKRLVLSTTLLVLILSCVHARPKEFDTKERRKRRRLNEPEPKDATTTVVEELTKIAKDDVPNLTLATAASDGRQQQRMSKKVEPRFIMQVTCNTYLKKPQENAHAHVAFQTCTMNTLNDILKFQSSDSFRFDTVDTYEIRKADGEMSIYVSGSLVRDFASGPFLDLPMLKKNNVKKRSSTPTKTLPSSNGLAKSGGFVTTANTNSIAPPPGKRPSTNFGDEEDCDPFGNNNPCDPPIPDGWGGRRRRRLEGMGPGDEIDPVLFSALYEKMFGACIALHGQGTIRITPDPSSSGSKKKPKRKLSCQGRGMNNNQVSFGI